MTVVRLAIGCMVALLAAGGPVEARMMPDDPSSAQAPRSVFVLLVGYPVATRELPVLKAVTADVAMMHAFFGTLSPDHTFVHLPAGDVRADLRGPRTSVAEPTWPAIEASVDRIAEEVADRGGQAEVYVYYAGHGRKRRVGSHTHTDLFLQPGSGDVSHNGLLTTRLLHRGILSRLDGPDTRVHLIVDACQSAYLLEARGMRLTKRVFKAPPAVEPAMLDEFARRYDGVGALLATSGSQVTYESPDEGGLFSYAIRTAGIGSGDLDGDGRVTYRELNTLLPNILSDRAGAAVPLLLPPGGRDDEAFLDFRGRGRMASVTFEAEDDGATRFELKSLLHEPYAAIFPEARSAVRVFLPDGAAFLAAARVGKKPRVWSRFLAADSAFAALQEPLDGTRVIARVADPAFELPPLVLPRPITAETLVRVEEPEWVWVPERYVTVGLSGLTEAPLYGRTRDSSTRAFAGGAEVVGAFGDGADQVSWRVGYAHRFADWWVEPPDVGSTRVIGEMARVAVGYQRVLTELSMFELSGGGFVGGGLLIEDRTFSYVDEETHEVVTDTSDATIWVPAAGVDLTTRVLVPDSVWALRMDLRFGGQLLLDENQPWVDLVASASVGIEYEFVLR